MDVGVLHSFLETFPVLSSGSSLDFSIHFVLLHLFLEELLSVSLTVVSELGVQIHTTIRASVTANFQVVDGFLLVVVSVLDSSLQVFHLFAAGLRATEVSLLDQELNVSLERVLDDALELVGSNNRSIVLSGSELSGNNKTVSNLYLRNFHFFLAVLSSKAEIEFALCHSRIIVETARLSVLTTLFVVDHSTILFYFLADVSNRLTFEFFSVEFEDGSNGKNAFLSEFLYRERTCDVCIYLVTNNCQGTRVNCDLFGLWHSAAGCQHCHCNDRHKK